MYRYNCDKCRKRISNAHTIKLETSGYTVTTQREYQLCSKCFKEVSKAITKTIREK